MGQIGNLLVEAVTLMVTGMVVVFLFLTVMVYVVILMSKLVPKEVTELSSTPSSTSPKIQTNSRGHLAPQVIAAISAAVHQYRSSVNRR